jgi:uncharacterized membrane protein
MFFSAVWMCNIGRAATPYYSVTVVTPLLNVEKIFAPLLNDRGEIAALVTSNEMTEAWVLIIGPTNTRSISVPILNYSSSPLLSFNHRGEVVVDTLWNDYVVRDGGFIFLSNLIDATYFTVAGLNDRGVLVGGAQHAPGAPMFAYRHFGGTNVIYRGLTTNAHAGATALNNRGTVVGAAQAVSGALGSQDHYHAVVFRPGRRPRDLGTLPGDSSAIPTGISDRGGVIGYSTRGSDLRTRGFHFRRGRMRPLPWLPNHLRSLPTAVNNRGYVVGRSIDDQFQSRPVLWAKGTVYDLDDCIPEDSGISVMRVHSINNQGWILATAGDGIEESSVVLLKPATRAKPTAN